MEQGDEAGGAVTYKSAAPPFGYLNFPKQQKIFAVMPVLLLLIN